MRFQKKKAEPKIPELRISAQLKNAKIIRNFEKEINTYFNVISKYTKDISNSIFPTTVAQRKSLSQVCSMLDDISDELKEQSNKIVVAYNDLQEIPAKARTAYACQDNLNKFLFMQIKCAMSFTCFRTEYVTVCRTLKNPSYEEYFDVYGGVLIRAKEAGGKEFMGMDTLPCEMERNALRQYITTEANVFTITDLTADIKENRLEITGTIENIGEKSETAKVKAICGQQEAISEIGEINAGESNEFKISLDKKDAEYCELTTE